MQIFFSKEDRAIPDTNQPDNAIPEPEFSSQLDLLEFSQKLLECSTLHNKDKRMQVIGLLPHAISVRIDHADNSLSHVYNMVTTCHNFGQGLTQLLEAVYSLEGDSKGWQAVVAYLQQVAPGWKSPARPTEEAGAELAKTEFEKAQAGPPNKPDIVQNQSAEGQNALIEDSEQGLRGAVNASVTQEQKAKDGGQIKNSKQNVDFK